MFAHTGSLNQERKLDSLRKKEVDNLTEYLARKEERMEKKNNKNKLQDNGHAKMDDSTIEPTTEREAKRPKLEAASWLGQLNTLVYPMNQTKLTNGLEYLSISSKLAAYQNSKGFLLPKQYM